VVKVVHACLERRPGHRPAPHEVADHLQPVLERLPRARLTGFGAGR
jgi:serine/threonine-protein kinase